MLGRCYQCNKIGHHAWQFLDKKPSTSHGGERRTQLAQEEDNESVKSPSHHVAPEIGESLMVRKMLIKVPMVKEPP